MVIVNLTELGPVAPRWVNRAELATTLEAAEEIMADVPAAELAAILTEWELGLTWRSLEATPVDDAWYHRALLVTCLRGLRGEIQPSFYWITDND